MPRHPCAPAAPAAAVGAPRAPLWWTSATRRSSAPTATGRQRCPPPTHPTTCPCPCLAHQCGPWLALCVPAPCPPTPHPYTHPSPRPVGPCSCWCSRLFKQSARLKEHVANKHAEEAGLAQPGPAAAGHGSSSSTSSAAPAARAAAAAAGAGRLWGGGWGGRCQRHPARGVSSQSAARVLMELWPMHEQRTRGRSLPSHICLSHPPTPPLMPIRLATTGPSSQQQGPPGASGTAPSTSGRPPAGKAAAAAAAAPAPAASRTMDVGARAGYYTEKSPKMLLQGG